ncbi:MAG TPA: DUF4830 domain-containing protein [Oscillospiraceae bacterium]|nr:DUF4830 domain-containing protein [Oscillospiraceae bacterium]
MLVMSIRSSKFKIFAIVLAAVILVGAAIIFTVKRNSVNTESLLPVKIKGGTSDERIEFLESCGLKVEQEPLEVTEIIIPVEFDEVYKEYNEIQTRQGFDLQSYCGKRVKKWTYKVTNYPGYGEDSDAIRANILVFNSLIIGGDVSSVELDGFIHGFVEKGKDASLEGESAKDTTVTTTTKTTEK